MTKEEAARNYLTRYLGNLLSIEPSSVDPSTPLNLLGLDSGSSMALLADYEKWMDGELSQEAFERSHSINELVALHLSMSGSVPFHP